MKPMKWLSRGSGALWFVLLLGVGGAGLPAGRIGCAGEAPKAAPPPAGEPAPPPGKAPLAPPTMAPPPPGVVLTYEPPTLDETEAVVKLAASDLEMRLAIEKAEDEALRAVAAYRAAALSFRRAGQPGRVTKEQLDEVYKAADAKVARYQSLIQTQRDRYENFFAKYPDNWFERHRYATFLADHHLNEEAAAQWRRVIEQAPTFPYAYNNLGTLYNHMGRDLEAMLLYRKAIELYPEDAGFYENLAVSYSTHRAEASKEFGWDLPRVFRECIQAYQRARALDPQNTEIAYDLASQYVLAKFFGVQDTADEAIAAWTYYLGLNLTPTQRAVADRNLGSICLRQKNDPAAAQHWLEEAVSLLPGDPTCRMLLEQAKAAQAKKSPGS